MQDHMVFVRFKDLKKRNIVRARSTLVRFKRVYDFPEGRLIGGERCWTEQEIEDWLKRCPKEREPLPRDDRGRVRSRSAA